MSWYPEKTYSIRKVSGGFILKDEKKEERVFGCREDLLNFLFPEDIFANDPDPHYGPGDPVTVFVTVSAGAWGQNYGRKFEWEKKQKGKVPEEKPPPGVSFKVPISGIYKPSSDFDVAVDLPAGEYTLIAGDGTKQPDDAKSESDKKIENYTRFPLKPGRDFAGDVRETLRAEPIPDYGDHMTMEEFIENVRSGLFTDDDGHGNYATADKMLSDRIVHPSMVECDLDTSWSHVVWFNK